MPAACSEPSTFAAAFRVDVATTMSTDAVCDGSRGLLLLANGAAPKRFATFRYTSALSTLRRRNELVYAARLSVTIGRCFRPAR